MGDCLICTLERARWRSRDRQAVRERTFPCFFHTANENGTKRRRKSLI